MLATFLAALDTTVVGTAMPTIIGALGGLGLYSWVFSAYLLTSTTTVPVYGRLSDMYGRKPIFAIGAVLFLGGSALCGAATNMEQLILFRAIQGLGAGAVLPVSMTVVGDIYPVQRRAQIQGLFSAVWGVSAILGPTVGGVIVDSISWRWVFYINLPFGMLALAGIALFVSETERDRERPFDWFGFTMLSLAIGALQLMLDRGESQDWFSSTEIIIEAVVAGLCFYMFVAHMLTARRPFLEPGLFRDRNLVTGLFFIFIVGIILLATLALLPPFLQQLMGYPVITTGFVLAPRGVGTMIAMVLVGRLITRVNVRLLILLGLSLTSLSLWEMAGFTLEVSEWDLIRTGITQGLGLGFIFVPLSTVTFATLAPHLRTEGTALFSLMRNIGSSIGISVVVTLLARNTQTNHAILSQHATPLNPVFQWPDVSRIWDLSSIHGLSALNAEVTRQAATIAYLDDFRLMMVVTLLAVPMLLLLRTPKRSAGPAVEVTPE